MNITNILSGRKNMPCIIQTLTAVSVKNYTTIMNPSKHILICQNGFTMMKTITCSVLTAQSANTFHQL